MREYLILRSRSGDFIMKKINIFTIVSLIICISALSGCARDINYIVDNEPCVKGVVSQISETYIVISVNEDDELHKSYKNIEVSRNDERKDGAFGGEIGDEVAVYYDGSVEETDPARINQVYAILYVGDSK